MRAWLGPLLAQDRSEPVRLVDVGCGVGHVVRWLAATGVLGPRVELVGVDLNSTLVRHAGLLAEREGLRCRFVTGDAFTPGLAVEHAPRTVVISTGMLHHIAAEELQAFFAAQQQLGVAGFAHWDIDPSRWATVGAWVFHRARMRRRSRGTTGCCPPGARTRQRFSSARPARGSGLRAGVHRRTSVEAVARGRPPPGLRSGRGGAMSQDLAVIAALVVLAAGALVLLALSAHVLLDWRRQFVASALVLGPFTLGRPAVALGGAASGAWLSGDARVAVLGLAAAGAVLAVEPLAGRQWYAVRHPSEALR